MSRTTKETTLFWHAECTNGMSLDFKTTGEHIEPIPDCFTVTTCPICKEPHDAKRVTQGEHGAYVADCTGADACPAYYHEHGCYADVDGSTCNDAGAHDRES